MQMYDKESLAFKHKNQCWKSAQAVPVQSGQKQTLDGRHTAPRLGTKGMKYS